MRISSVGTVWHRETLQWKRVELVAVPRTTENRRVFEVLPSSPAQLAPGQREAATYVATKAEPRAPLIDDWF